MSLHGLELYRRFVAGAALLVATAAPGAEYLLPVNGDNVIGSNTTAIAAHEDTLLDIGRRHGVGYEEILAANPGVDPWLPGEGTEVLIPARFILPDRGEPVPYLIDADSLPVGMTQSQGIWAVKMALAAWTNATSLRFVLVGMQSFGIAAINVTASDGVLRLQLHDNYNYINSPGKGINSHDGTKNSSDNDAQLISPVP